MMQPWTHHTGLLGGKQALSEKEKKSVGGAPLSVSIIIMSVGEKL
jgi:hypothetical protein